MSSSDRRPSAHRTKRGKPLARLVQAVLALGGLGFFINVVRNVNFSDLPKASLESLPVIICIVVGLFLVNYTFDTASWWIIAGEKRPSLFRLALIRLKCEGVTNSIPGGAVVGEPMKVGMLMSESAMTRPEATTSFLISKFVLVFGQILYILVGLSLSYTVIGNVSESIFKVDDFAVFVFVGALSMLGLIVSIAAAMVLVQPMNRKFRLSTRDGWIARWWNIGLKELRQIETLVAAEFRRHRFHLILAVTFSFIAWSLNGVELYFIVQWLDVNATFEQVYAIDAVSVIVRMLIFVIPIGMGGQDMTMVGLASAHGIVNPKTTVARMVLLKRGREFMAVGIGLLLLLLHPKRTTTVENRIVET